MSLESQSEKHATDRQGTDLRGEADRLIAAGNSDLAALSLAELWRKDSKAATASFVVSRFERLRDKLPLTPYRVAILRSFTVEPVVPLLRADAYARGIDLTVHVGDFNTFAQEILDSASSLYRFKPDAVILAAQTSDLAPDLTDRYADLIADAASEAVRRVSNSFEQWIRGFRQHSAAAFIVHSLELPLRASAGVLDAQRESGQSAAIHQINRDLTRIASSHRNAYVLDYDGLVARHGRLHWRDERKWLIARLPIAADHLIDLAREWMRFLVPLTGKIAKVLVTDLDNTLWGGVIGEDGMNGIKLSAEYPGAAYQQVQRTLLDLTKRGVLLAVCSKNNRDDAMEAIEKHPGMLLRSSDFASFRINWTDKAQNLREIAAELNLGIDSLVFLDDNPFEREQVRKILPEVTIVDLPHDPLGFAAAIRECPLFERLTLSSEDQRRTAMYVKERERSEAEQTFQSKEDFFRYLEQEAEIAPVSPATLARVAQLTQKTNQFNLTTRRYTEQQIAELSARPEWRAFSIKVRDRFGDHGLVGVAMTRDENKTCEIDTFLLSCRVIGRTVETALLGYLAQQAAGRKCQTILGRFLPTRKNAPARDFYAQHEFQLQEENPQGSVWSLSLENHTIAIPDWIRLKTTEGDHN
jgi:FkbH-like protein